MTKLEQDIKRFESWQNLETLFEYAETAGVHITKAKYSDRNKPGIHLIEPNYNELNEAITQAATELQDTIWCHDTIQYQFKLIIGGKN
jgi:hypothetical protein